MQDLDRPFRGRRLTWHQFYELRPDRRPENDNVLADDRHKPPGGASAFGDFKNPHRPHPIALIQTQFFGLAQRAHARNAREARSSHSMRNP